MPPRFKSDSGATDYGVKSDARHRGKDLANVAFLDFIKNLFNDDCIIKVVAGDA